MNEEQVLEKRIAELEKILAELQRERESERTGRIRWYSVVLSVAAVVILVLAVSPGTKAAGKGMEVTAPFHVVDQFGHGLFSVELGPNGTGMLSIFDGFSHRVVEIQSGPDGGQVSVFNKTDQLAAQMAASSGCCGRLMVFQGGDSDPKAIMGVHSSGYGVFRAWGQDQGYSQITGGGFSLRGSSGKFAALLGQIDGDGELDLNSKEGKHALQLNSESGDGLLRAFGDAGPVAVLGSSAGIGMLRLNGDAKANRSLLARGDGKVSVMNLDGVEVMAAGVDSNNQGYFVANNAHGGQAASLSVGGDGTGLAQVWKSGEVGVIMGTKNGTNGDLCANGPKSSVCLSILAAKTFTPY